MHLKRGGKVYQVDLGINAQIKHKFHGKKGISPLIATVLLIAFAVAIATMIMNVGKDFVGSTAGDCADVKLEVQTINAKPLLCYDPAGGKVSFMLKNTGSVDVSSLKLLVTSASGAVFSTDEQAIADSAVKSGDTIIKNYPYAKNSTFKLEIVPIITAAGKGKTCLDKSVIAEQVAICS